ncbi:sugar phosphate isomerase/epimerase and 4-hydroxyphenylpyruvate domain-containing protein [Microbacteriaceae bacterium VKM Ac-2855]|nr:sugar phosphate isomerase/epimerase and 4-hydroxyphenylpyruvate domain-containing protein [Microbacteriaceae bacterium VKM Ac-2855]
MRTSIATVCVSGTLDEKIDAIAGAGFHGIELFETDLVTSALTPEDVAKRCADRGLTIDLYQPFRDFEGVEPSLLTANLARAERKFELMHRLGTDRILVCSNVATATLPYDEVAVDQLGRLAELAASHGIQVAYEALAWGRYVSTYEHAWRIVEQVDHPALGVCLDSFHILSRESGLDTIADIPAEKIGYLQIADAPRMSLDVLSWSRHYRLFPGEGSWDLTDFVRRVLDAGYSGPLSLEVFNDDFRQSDPRATAVEAHRSLVALEEAVARRPGGALDSALPAHISVGGFGFVELSPTVDDDVETMLASLGFRRSGPHRRKNATLWSRGGAQIVVNRALDRAEVGIVAIGLEVDDVDAAAARAQALQNPLLDRDRRADEELLLAVGAPDGTEIYFSATGARDGAGWTSEFGPVPRPIEESASAGIVEIDHISLVQPWDRVDEAVLFFRSLLGLSAGDLVDVPGASGLVRSRSLVSSDSTVRIALNALPTHAREEADYPNHVAFRTDDLLATLRVLGDAVPLLPVPENYYEDLEARYALGAARLQELREANVLLDRSPQGEFLHVYTRPVGRVSFELVERRGDYDGYGAANAPVRLAAQRLERTRRAAPAA